MPLLASIPLLLVGLATAVLGVLVARALRDERVVDALRGEARRLGETHQAVCETRGVHPAVDRRPDGHWRLRG